MPKGILNPDYEFCRALALEIGNDSHPNVMRFMRELKNLRTWKDHERIVRHGFSGEEIVGYSESEIAACWHWLRTREEFPIREARLSTTLLGSPSYLQQFDAWVMDNLPPVYESSSHDAFVLEHGAVLKSLRFVYRCENQPGRLTTEKLIQCGLKETDGTRE